MKFLTVWKITAVLIVLTSRCCNCPPGHTVLAGTDYLQTMPDSSFDLTLPGATPTQVTFVGDPQPGNAYDTKVVRLKNAELNPGGQGTKVDIQMTELSLKNANPVSLNGKSYNVSVKLDSSKPSMGTMTISEDRDSSGKGTGQGTFTSSFDTVYFVATLTPVGGGGAISMPLTTSLTNEEGGKWVSIPGQGNPPCTVVTPKPKTSTDTNQHTDKTASELDIYPNGKINEQHSHTSRWHRAACI